METTQWFTSSIGLLTAGIILYLVRRDHLHTRYALWWIPVGIGIALLGLFPSTVDWLSPIIGIHYPPIIPAFIGILLLIIKILMMDIERSNNEVKLERAIQRLAILEQQLDELHQKKPE